MLKMPEVCLVAMTYLYLDWLSVSPLWGLKLSSNSNLYDVPRVPVICQRLNGWSQILSVSICGIQIACSIITTISAAVYRPKSTMWLVRDFPPFSHSAAGCVLFAQFIGFVPCCLLWFLPRPFDKAGDRWTSTTPPRMSNTHQNDMWVPWGGLQSAWFPQL